MLTPWKPAPRRPSAPAGSASAPPLVPVLSRGRHRSPRKGACFMEMASYLAGERWSDHPACTHPALAALARCVNDATSDAGRPALAPLIPSVVGLTGDDPLLGSRLALLCATRALPVVAEERQRVMAVAALAADGVLARAQGRDEADLLPGTRAALEAAPLAAAWARSFARSGGVGAGAHRRHAVGHVITSAVAGIACSCQRDPDALLRDLLVEAVQACRTATTAPDATETLAGGATPASGAVAASATNPAAGTPRARAASQRALVGVRRG